MKPVLADPELVADCGLYCGACGAYRRSRCPGCHENVRATWCGVRTCCGERGYLSCAECAEYPDPAGCRKFHNGITRLFGLVFRSDRRACVLKIRENGLRQYAEEMAAGEKVTIRR